MKVLQQAKRICNKIGLLGMMLNEEKNSTMAELGYIDAIKPSRQ